MPPTGLDRRTLERLLDVGHDLVSELDLESVLRQVLAVGRELTGARYAALGILDQRREELERFVHVGIDEETARAIGPLPRGRGILGELIRDPRPLRLPAVSEHPRSYGFPPGHPEMRSFLGVPIRVRGEVYGNLYLSEKEDGPEFDESDEQAVVVLAEWAAIAIDNARLYEAVQERRLELERAVGGLEATLAIARALGGETDLGKVLGLIVKRGRALVEARWAVIMTSVGDQLVVEAAAGELPDSPVGRRLPIADSVAGEAFRSMVPERVADVSKRLRASARRERLDARSAMYVPLVFRGRALGVLVLADRLRGPTGEFSTDDERLMLAFAASAATAVATAQTVEAERLSRSIESAEQERGRWARELHDQTLQDLGALNVMLEMAVQSGKPTVLEQSVRAVLEQIEHTIRNLQGIITDLRPAALDELGLRPALETLVERAAALSGLAIDLSIDVPDAAGRLEPQLEGTAYRLVQEALNNVVKHAGASNVEVALGESGGLLLITVRDDGVGFEPASARRGFGLVGMRERVALVEGLLEVESRPGRGTMVRAELPMRRRPGRPATVGRRSARGASLSGRQ